MSYNIVTRETRGQTGLPGNPCWRSWRDSTRSCILLWLYSSTNMLCSIIPTALHGLVQHVLVAP
ncbi:hypothetical protein BDR03DRAFT_948006, partial [Suillus americanus]